MPNISRICVIFVLILAISSNVGIIQNSVNHPSNEHQNRDYWPTDEWIASSPEDQGMNSTILDHATTYIDNNSLPINSLLVIRHGYLVYENYPHLPLFDQNNERRLYSVTKSFSSALIGIAIDQGIISNTSQKLLSFFSNYNLTNYDQRKEQITLEQLLKMRSGFEWDEWTYPFTDSRNDVIQLIYASDSIQYLLDRDLDYDPGTYWQYNTGDSHLLSAIIHTITGNRTEFFAKDHLFDRIGIDSYVWDKDNLGINFGGFDLRLTPRNMARFGWLYLNNGTWDGERIISSDWITKSSISYTTIDSQTGYGYQFWINKNKNYYYAAGLYGQKIIVIPEQDMVVVYTANFQGSDYEETYILDNFIFKSVNNIYPSTIDYTDITDEYTSGDLFYGFLSLSLLYVIRKKNKRQY